MSDIDRPPLATGGMSAGGSTTVVKIGQPRVGAFDKTVLCTAICKCKDAPSVGQDGRQLRQICVSNALKGVDKAMGHQSPYKPEVNYDMTKNPPAPIMDSTIDTKPHDWLPGWIGKYWDTENPTGSEYKAGRGLIRRPDVVIVNDPSKPPTQDNIKQVVEMKFPPDELSQSQRDAYTKIAGGPQKFAKLEPNNCDCDKPEPSPPKVPAPDPKTLTVGAMSLMLLLGVLAF